MEWTGLNVFQRVTRHWDTIHPYNAAQVMKLAGRADRQSLLSLWRETLTQLKMTSVQRWGSVYRWEEGISQPEFIDVPPDTTLQQLMSEELDRTFDETLNMPFRAFVIEEENSYYAGIVYHHWVADSYSIRLLLREWFFRIHDPSQARRRPFQTPATGYWNLFGPDKVQWRLDESVINLFRWHSQFRRARRIEAKAFQDFTSNFSLYRAPNGLIQRVAKAAKRRKVTVNDVFLAAMAQVCDELLPAQRIATRPDIALGTVVDLRGRARCELRETFGLFLGFTSVVCREKELGDWDRLLDHVHHQNDRQRKNHAAEASMVRMFAALVTAKLMPPKRLLEFYRKRFAMAAGISNVNLNADWPGRFHPHPLLDYVRVSPAGPWMPLVFTPTTLGDGLNIGITSRRSVLDPQRVGALAAEFVDRLQRFAENAEMVEGSQ
ncbi:MAG TPA: hypothetical protein VHD56_15465 [Tepidisphaeraceae bacterium]|nr:hypothetical protein [Tepidisphaeraceae bacterium]